MWSSRLFTATGELESFESKKETEFVESYAAFLQPSLISALEKVKQSLEKSLLLQISSSVMTLDMLWKNLRCFFQQGEDIFSSFESICVNSQLRQKLPLLARAARFHLSDFCTACDKRLSLVSSLIPTLEEALDRHLHCVEVVLRELHLCLKTLKQQEAKLSDFITMNQSMAEEYEGSGCSELAQQKTEIAAAESTLLQQVGLILSFKLFIAPSFANKQFLPSSSPRAAVSSSQTPQSHSSCSDLPLAQPSIPRSFTKKRKLGDFFKSQESVPSSQNSLSVSQSQLSQTQASDLKGSEVEPTPQRPKSQPTHSTRTPNTNSTPFKRTVSHI